MLLSKTKSPALITAQKTKNGTEISEKKTQKPNFSNSDETISENGAKTALNVHVQGKIFIYTLPYNNKILIPFKNVEMQQKDARKKIFPVLALVLQTGGDK